MNEINEKGKFEYFKIMMIIRILVQKWVKILRRDAFNIKKRRFNITNPHLRNVANLNQVGSSWDISLQHWISYNNNSINTFYKHIEFVHKIFDEWNFFLSASHSKSNWLCICHFVYCLFVSCAGFVIVVSFGTVMCSSCYCCSFYCAVFRSANEQFCFFRCLLGVNEIEKFFTCFWIITEYTKHCRCNCFAVNLLNTSHHHAHVPETI